MEKNIDQKMEQQMVRLIQALEERLPKSDNVAQGTHENKDIVHVEQPSIITHIPRGFNSNIGDNHGWSPKGIHLHKIDMRKCDGNDPIIWIS